MKAVITGDIVNSSKIAPDKLVSLMEFIDEFIRELSERYNIMHQLFRGDSFQVLLNEPEYALEIIVMIRTYIIGLSPDDIHRYDVRMSCGFGDVDVVSDKIVVSTGEAFVRSGRALDKMKISERISVSASDEDFQKDLEICAYLMEVITSGLTVRRATMTCMFLCGKSRKEVASALQIIETTLSNTITSSYYRKLKRGLDWSVQFIKSYTEKL